MRPTNLATGLAGAPSRLRSSPSALDHSMHWPGRAGRRCGSRIDANDHTCLPKIGKQPDWKADLGVISRTARRYMTPDETQNFIAGYTSVDDMHTGELFSRHDVTWNADRIAVQP